MRLDPKRRASALETCRLSAMLPLCSAHTVLLLFWRHSCGIQGCSSGRALIQRSELQDCSGDMDLGPALQSSSVGPQLQQLSFAYSACLLCIEGSTAFELKLAEHISNIHGIARYCGISLQYFYAASQRATQVWCKICIGLRIFALVP